MEKGKGYLTLSDGHKVKVPGSRLTAYGQGQVPSGPESPYEQDAKTPSRGAGHYGDMETTTYRRAKEKYGDGKDFEGREFKL